MHRTINSTAYQCQNHIMHFKQSVSIAKNCASSNMRRSAGRRQISDTYQYLTAFWFWERANVMMDKWLWGISVGVVISVGIWEWFVVQQ